MDVTVCDLRVLGPSPQVRDVSGDTHRLAVGWLPVHVLAGRPQVTPVAALVVGYERHHLSVDFLVRQEDAFHPADLGQKPRRTVKPCPGRWWPGVLCACPSPRALCPRPTSPRRQPQSRSRLHTPEARDVGGRGSTTAELRPEGPLSDPKAGALLMTLSSGLCSQPQTPAEPVSRALVPGTATLTLPHLRAELLVQSPHAPAPLLGDAQDPDQ